MRLQAAAGNLDCSFRRIPVAWVPLDLWHPCNTRPVLLSILWYISMNSSDLTRGGLDSIDPFDLSRGGEESVVTTGPNRDSIPRHRVGEKFLKGPIPWTWIEAAAELPGQSLTVGIAIWFEAGCSNRASVPMTLSRIARLTNSRDSARRGLKKLEERGLVSVVRSPGRAARVTLCDPPGKPSV